MGITHSQPSAVLLIAARATFLIGLYLFTVAIFPIALSAISVPRSKASGCRVPNGFSSVEVLGQIPVRQPDHTIR